jgi:hypothetical protein
MAESKDPIDNLSDLADEIKKAVEPDVESASNSSVIQTQHDPVLEKRLLRKIDIWRKYMSVQETSKIYADRAAVSCRILLPRVHLSSDRLRKLFQCRNHQS